MIVQITAYITDFFKIESSDNSTCSHGEPEKKKLLNLAAGDRAQHIQSYPLE